MIDLKTTFSKRELMWFGPLFALFAGMIGGFVIWKFEAPNVAKWIWMISAGVIVIYYLVPPLRKWLYTGWMAAVFPIGWVISHVLLAAVFYLLVFPIGILMRLLKYDALSRRFDREKKSYWIERKKVADPRKYFRQY